MKMKPSERIHEICIKVCHEYGASSSPTAEQLIAAMVEAILRYLDEVTGGPHHLARDMADGQEPADP